MQLFVGVDSETVIKILNPISKMDDKQNIIIYRTVDGHASVALYAKDGKNYNVVFYSLEMIIAVGYRIRGLRGTQFRQWATEHKIQKY